MYNKLNYEYNQDYLNTFSLFVIEINILSNKECFFS